MGIEGGSNNNEVQNQEIQQATNEQVEQSQALHERNGEELEANSTIDNEGERKQIEGKDEATEGQDEQSDSEELAEDDQIEADSARVDEATVEPENTEADDLAAEDTISCEAADGLSDDEIEEDDSEEEDDLENDAEIESDSDLENNEEDSAEDDEEEEDDLSEDDSIESDDASEEDSVEDDEEEEDDLSEDDSIESDGEDVEDENPDGDTEDENPDDDTEDENPDDDAEDENPDDDTEDENPDDDTEDENPDDDVEDENPEDDAEDENPDDDVEDENPDDDTEDENPDDDAEDENPDDDAEDENPDDDVEDENPDDDAEDENPDDDTEDENPDDDVEDENPEDDAEDENPDDDAEDENPDDDAEDENPDDDVEDENPDDDTEDENPDDDAEDENPDDDTEDENPDDDTEDENPDDDVEDENPDDDAEDENPDDDVEDENPDDDTEDENPDDDVEDENPDDDTEDENLDDDAEDENPDDDAEDENPDDVEDDDTDSTDEGDSSDNAEDSSDGNGEKKLEDYSYDQIMDMLHSGPGGKAQVEALLADSKERIEAEWYGMTQEEYQDYKAALKRAQEKAKEEKEKEEKRHEAPEQMAKPSEAVAKADKLLQKFGEMDEKSMHAYMTGGKAQNLKDISDKNTELIKDLKDARREVQAERDATYRDIAKMNYDGSKEADPSKYEDLCKKYYDLDSLSSDLDYAVIKMDMNNYDISTVTNAEYHNEGSKKLDNAEISDTMEKADAFLRDGVSDNSSIMDAYRLGEKLEHDVLPSLDGSLREAMSRVTMAEGVQNSYLAEHNCTHEEAMNHPDGQYARNEAYKESLQGEVDGIASKMSEVVEKATALHDQLPLAGENCKLKVTDNHNGTVTIERKWDNGGANTRSHEGKIHNSETTTYRNALERTSTVTMGANSNSVYAKNFSFQYRGLAFKREDTLGGEHTKVKNVAEGGFGNINLSAGYKRGTEGKMSTVSTEASASAFQLKDTASAVIKDKDYKAFSAEVSLLKGSASAKIDQYGVATAKASAHLAGGEASASVGGIQVAKVSGGIGTVSVNASSLTGEIKTSANMEKASASIGNNVTLAEKKVTDGEVKSSSVFTSEPLKVERDDNGNATGVKAFGLNVDQSTAMNVRKDVDAVKDALDGKLGTDLTQKGEVVIDNTPEKHNSAEIKGKGEDQLDPERHRDSDYSFRNNVADLFKGKESSYDVARAEAHGLEKGCFDAIPRDRREAVFERFENAPSEIKNIVNMNEKLDLRVESTKERTDCCHYDMREQVIRMENYADNDVYAEVFSHEYGHMVDDKLGHISDSFEFRKAYQEDLKQYDLSTEQGKANFNEMMDALFSSDACMDRMVSDNLSSFFVNKTEVSDRFDSEGVSYYMHPTEYWYNYGNREAEVFANCFSMYASNEMASCEFMKTYFPNTWNSFVEGLSKEGEQ